MQRAKKLDPQKPPSSKRALKIEQQVLMVYLNLATSVSSTDQNLNISLKIGGLSGKI
ncbi:hypothetical protein [Campylobacter sp. RM16189]|uniref:hypothetical protein n=1 Tax=Campylobacter sp. RM16189 TaxID=1705726 RepID=UPI001B8B2C6E|nr:hypothetical protein [Campylobacter sp. RM16189]